MGVTGLWGILEPTGKPVRIQSLRGKVLSVDVSIWLHQSVKGFRDKDGNPIRNSHLLGVFHRVCKLLSHGIKPVFVFDGGVPVLKRQTMAIRRQRKIEAQDKSHASRKKIIQNLLKQQLQRQYLTDLPATEEIDEEIDRVIKAGSKISNKTEATETTKSPSKKSSKKPKGEKDEFDDDFEKFREKLTENFNNFSIFLSELDSKRSASESDDSDSEGLFEEPRSYDENFDSILKPAFDELPLEIQHEMLFEMQESRKNNSWGKMDQMPKDLKDFSSFQMERLRKRRTLQKKIQTVQKEMGQRHIHLSNFDDLAAMEYDEVPTAVTNQVLASKEKGLVYIKSSPVKPSDNAEPVAGSSKIQPKSNNIEDIIIANSSSDDEFCKGLTEEQQLHKAIQLSIEETQGKQKDGAPEKIERTYGLQTCETDDKMLEKAIQLSLECPQRKLAYENSAEDLETNDDVVFEIEKKQAISCNSETGKNGVECLTISPKAQITVESAKMNSQADDDISMTDSSSSDFEEVVVEEEESKPKVVLESVDKNAQQSITIAFDTVDSFKEEDDIFADVFTSPISVGGVENVGIQDTISYDEKSEQIELSDGEGSCKKEEAIQEAIMSSDSDFEEIPEEASCKELDKSVDTEKDRPARTLGTDPTKSVRMISAQYMQAQERLNKEKEELVSSKGFQERIATSITDQMYSEAQELLALFGVPYIVSPMEAESQCAFLDTACLTEGTITDDSDIWLFGGQRVYKNFFSQGDRQLELFEYAEIVQALNMDREKLVLIAILTGSDYTDGVEGVGPVKALEILSEFPSPTISAFDSLIKFREWWDRAQENKKLDSDNKIRDKLRKLKLRPGFPSKTVYDAYINPTIDESLEPFRWGTADLEALRTYTKEKFGWNQQKCDAALFPLIKSLRCQAEDSTRQLTMDAFIQFGAKKGHPKKRKIKSKRLELAMKKLRGPRGSSEVKLSSESESEPEPTSVANPSEKPQSESQGMESDDEELDSLLTRMGVKRLKVNRGSVATARGKMGRGLARGSNGRPNVATYSPVSSSSGASSPATSTNSPGIKVVTPTKKTQVIPQKAREEFQRQMNKKKAIELLKKKNP